MSIDNRHLPNENGNASSNKHQQRNLANRIRHIDKTTDMGKSRARWLKSEHHVREAPTAEFYTSEEDNSSLEVELEPAFNLDKYNIALLFFLYVLQGVPLGLSAAVPMLLQNRGISYKEQAQFSFVLWPFSLKLLWAPIVDYLYIRRWGRRKTWLIPTQYLLAVFMMLLAMWVDDWLGKDTVPNIKLITFFFFVLNFLAATQDIAVDGWALTMLNRCNVGYSSTCNSVGQTVGYFLGYVLFMALESAEFCNSYIRSVPQPEGIVTLQSYLFAWSFIFLIATTLVAIFKSEVSQHDLHVARRRQSSIRLNIDAMRPEPETPDNMKESYSILLSIIKLKPVRLLAGILLTAKIGFAACDGVTHLKLMEAGVPKEKMAIMAIPIVPLQMMLPLIISKYTTGRSPMNVYIKSYPYRLFLNILIAIVVWVTPTIISWHGSVPYYYYALLIILYCIEQVTVYSMFVATMAFFARISDPSVGGTYMTLLNTLSNLGSSWTTTTALWLVDIVTFKSCTVNNHGCSTPDTLKMCTDAGGKCETTMDGYFIESTVCTILGVIWFLWSHKKILHLQELGNNSWLRRELSHRTR